MSRYRIQDEDAEPVIVDTELARAHWDEDTRWDGRNHISVATGSQWDHEALYCSKKGRYWLESTSQREGSPDSAVMVSREDAARWLLANGHQLPADLADLADQVAE